MPDFSSPIDLGLPATPDFDPTSAQAIFEEIGRLYNGIRTIQERLGSYAGTNVLDPNNFIATNAPFSESIQTHRLQTILVQASATVDAGKFGNLHNVAGALRCRHADANAIATRAHGWFPYGITIGNVGLMYLFSGYVGAAALTPATTYYLSATTPGGITAVAPVVVGTIKQEVGVALSATDLAVRLSTPIIN